jgi:cation diffusion facilitator family transporter
LNRGFKISAKDSNARVLENKDTLVSDVNQNQLNDPRIVSLQEDDLRSNARLMLAAVIVGVVLMGLKFYGYWITGSSALLSDALESIINVVASVFGLGSVLISAKPADESHPYGHGSIEFFSAGFEGSLILIAALGIFFEGIKQVLNPVAILNLQTGLFFLIVSGIGNLLLGLVLLRIGRRTKSIVLEADGKHLLTDVYTSVAILVGLVLVYLTGWYQLDGIIACAAGLNIVYWGTGLVRRASGGLMHASDPQLLDEITQLLKQHKKEIWIDIHKLRAWQSGRRVHVDFHLCVPVDMSIMDGHREVKELELLFFRHFRGMSDILIHLDPCKQTECSFCEVDPCDERKEDVNHKNSWDRQTLTRDTQT